MLRYAISDGNLALGQVQARRFDGIATSSAPQPPATPSTCSGSPAEHVRAGLRERLLTHAASVASRQIDFFLLREPALPSGQLAALCRDLLGTFAASRTRLLIHSRLDIAIATRAHGVHLPSSPGQLTPVQIRSLYETTGLLRPTISLSCHTEEDLYRAHTLLPDLILFGPVFGKQVQGTEVRPALGLEALRQACRLAAPIPVLALGSITEASTPGCLQAGAAGIAAIRLFAPC